MISLPSEVFDVTNGGIRDFFPNPFSPRCPPCSFVIKLFIVVDIG